MIFFWPFFVAFLQEYHSQLFFFSVSILDRDARALLFYGEHFSNRAEENRKVCRAFVPSLSFEAHTFLLLDCLPNRLLLYCL